MLEICVPNRISKLCTDQLLINIFCSYDGKIFFCNMSYREAKIMVYYKDKINWPRYGFNLLKQMQKAYLHIRDDAKFNAGTYSLMGKINVGKFSRNDLRLRMREGEKTDLLNSKSLILTRRRIVCWCGEDLLRHIRVLTNENPRARTSDTLATNMKLYWPFFSHVPLSKSVHLPSSYSGTVPQAQELFFFRHNVSS